MDRESVVRELKSIIGDYLKSQGLDLVDLIYRYEGRDLFLRILIDKPESGITLDECAYINDQVGLILDEKEIIPVGYILEVSSPGLDRPLKTKGDFLRCINRKVHFFLTEKINGRMEWEGRITKAEENSVYISCENRVIEIPLTKIIKAKQIVENK